MLISNGFIQLELDELHGGRIKSLGLYNRENLLFQAQNNIKKKEWVNYGGDFLWVAPQARWSWPPIAEFDSLPWDVFQNNEIVMVSPVWQGIQLRRVFDFESTNCLKVTNIICNTGVQAQSWGLWNISQLPLENLEVKVSANRDWKVFEYPENVSVASLINSGYLSQNENEFIIKGVKGLDFKIGTIADVGKIVICNGKYKLTKSFDVACKETQYPHNCNLEIYKNNEYLEAEIVWPMTELKASEEFAVNQYFEIEVL